MVCSRCKATVRSKLDKLGIRYQDVELGEVTVNGKLSSSQHKALNSSLKQSGFELISEKKNELIEKLKRTISDLENCSNENLQISFPDFISMNVKDSFISLNTLFSEIEGISIEKYIIKQKVEQVKELLDQNILDISEIAARMHYSSVAQLSGQFKSITGLTPLHFKQLRNFSIKNTSIN